MEAMLDFVGKFNDVVKRHIEETRQCIGKEVVDSNASKNGICVDRIKYAFGAKFSLLGYRYQVEDTKALENFSEDVIVCQSGNGMKYFIPVSDIVAIGTSVVLIRSAVNAPEMGDSKARKQEVFKKYFTTTRAIKEILPKVETRTRSKSKRSITHLFH